MGSNLMTWVAIIAVVLAGIVAIYLLMLYFGGMPVYLGPSCTAEPTFVCHALSLSFYTGGAYDTLNVTIGQTGVSTLYNLQIACVSNYSGTGTMLMPVPHSAWQTISSSGQALQEGGISATAFDLGPEGGISISGLKCYNQTGAVLANEPNGSVYSGALLANFSTVRCDSVPCNWEQLKVATFTLKVAKQ